MKAFLLSASLIIYLTGLVFADVENINNHKLKLLISKGVPIIDIREEFEWKETGVILQSHLITFYDSEGKYDIKKWLNDFERITSRDDPVIIICRSGRRSLILANYLSKNEKFAKVYNVTLGIKGWIDDEYEIRDFK